MKIRFIMIFLFSIGLTVGSYSDRFNINYKLPFTPLEFTFDKNGMHLEVSQTIVTPLGSFSLGYSNYPFKFEENYTYVIVKDMTLKKEHIYKVNDKKILKLVSEGRTEIKITKNKVEIIFDKGSDFKVSFSIEEREIGNFERICRNNGGNFTIDDICWVSWSNAKPICDAFGKRLYAISELEKVFKDCYNGRNNDEIESCLKRKGFSWDSYWSREGEFIDFQYGANDEGWRSDSIYANPTRAVQCK